ncbi:hypothetical protein BKA63DRAFT_71924 [Paraphoma chrysanthemicola]|nr:hypothetical protein BKA63DRAFT_71924 [Paraphoma chrysanthemicola]
MLWRFVSFAYYYCVASVEDFSYSRVFLASFSIPVVTVHYFFYILSVTKVSESCFFMPFAPQSIYDWDQAFSLTAGLMLLVFTDIVPGVRQGVRLLNRLPESEGNVLELVLDYLSVAKPEEMEMANLEAGLDSGSNEELAETY